MTVEVCGNAQVSGQIGLQGRPQPGSLFSGPPSLFEVKLVGPFGTYSATPSAADGTYTISGVKFASAGTDYDIVADHSVYLKASKSLTVNAAVISGENTTLLGGDATNNGTVGPGDLACVGGLFGLPGPYQCAGGDPTTADLNNDAIVNIQDLALVAGNYALNETPPQSW